MLKRSLLRLPGPVQRERHRETSCTPPNDFDRVGRRTHDTRPHWQRLKSVAGPPAARPALPSQE